MSQLPDDFNQSWLGRLFAPLTQVIGALSWDADAGPRRNGVMEDYEAARRRQAAKRQRQAR